MIKGEKIAKETPNACVRMWTQTHSCTYNFVQVFSEDMNINIICDPIWHKSGIVSCNIHVGLLQGKRETTEPQVSETYLMASSPFNLT